MLSSPPQPLRVLVLDGHHRHALAAVRSLGRRHARVVVAAALPHIAAGASRFCAEAVRAPDPRHAPDAFVHWLLERLRRAREEVVVFFDIATAAILSAHQQALDHLTGCALPEPALFLESMRPAALPALAAEVGLGPAPPSAGAAAHHDFALLALLRRGDPVASFVHRLRAEEVEAALPWYERTASESAHQPEVRRLGLDLLARRCWHGVATVGFRHDLETDRLTLLGLHPAWTDGMDLAIACGIDMPWLYGQLAAGRPITGPTSYRVGRKHRRVFSPPRTLHLAAPRPEAWTALRLDSGTDRFFHDPLPHLPTVERAAVWLRRQLGRRRRTTAARPRHLRVVSGRRRPPCDR